MKTLLVAAVVAACVPLHGAAARQRPQLVVTAPESSVAEWVDHVSRQISARMRPPAMVQPGELASGRAAITFVCDGTGRPTAVTLVRRSGYPMLDQISLQAIRHMSPMGPMPSSFAAGQRFRANIVFAQSQDDYDSQIADLRREEATARIAAAAAPADREIALNIASPALRPGS